MCKRHKFIITVHVIIPAGKFCTKCHAAWNIVHIRSAANGKALPWLPSFCFIYCQQRLHKRIRFRHTMRIAGKQCFAGKAIRCKTLLKLLQQRFLASTKRKPNVYRPGHTAIFQRQHTANTGQCTRCFIGAGNSQSAAIGYTMREKLQQSLTVAKPSILCQCRTQTRNGIVPCLRCGSMRCQSGILPGIALYRQMCLLYRYLRCNCKLCLCHSRNGIGRCSSLHEANRIVDLLLNLQAQHSLLNGNQRIVAVRCKDMRRHCCMCLIILQIGRAVFFIAAHDKAYIFLKRNPCIPNGFHRIQNGNGRPFIIDAASAK